MSRKGNDDESVAAFYGISRTTFSVKTVWLSRGNDLSCMDDKGFIIKKFVEKGQIPKHEVSLCFDLTEIKEFSIHSIDSIAAQKYITDLKVKAEEMKKATTRA